MAKYITKRVLLMIPTLLGIMLVAFLMIRNLPGSHKEFSCYGDGDALDRFYQSVGAEDNTATQFVRYVYDLVVKGSMSNDIVSQRPITGEVSWRMKNTLMVSALGVLFAILIGIPAGILSALYHNGWQDRSLSVATLLLASIPSFCLAIILSLIFVLWLRVLPIFAFTSWKGYVMPTMVLGVGGVAIATRMTRASVLEILAQPHIIILQAKGLSDRMMLLHILKNAIVPVIAVISNTAISVLCSTLVVENFFSVPGIGAYLLNAVGYRRQRQLLGGVFVIAVVIMAINLVTDVAYIIAEPQRRAQLASKGRANRKGMNHE